MNPEWFWGRPVASTFVTGLVFGIFLAVFAAPHAPLEVALLVALACGTMFGGFIVVFRWKSWPTGRRLTAADRVAVARAVSRGEDAGENRLAPAVSELASVPIKNAERSARQRWVLWIMLAVTIASAVAGTTTSSVLDVALSWLLVALWLWIIVWQPRRLSRYGVSAVQAQLLALDRMPTDEPRDSIW